MNHLTSPVLQSRRTLVSLAVALAMGQYGAALAAPAGSQVVNGQVTVTRPDPLQTVISQASQAAIVNWQQFSIGANERVDIRQPNASSVLLNRVIGNNPSEIYGRLSANGQVFLVNPNGVLFGRTAQVSVGGLVASTLDIANDDFLAGRYRFSGNGANSATLDNQGSLQARDGGTIALLGGRVNNDGTISARLGTAALAAGDKIALDFEGDGLTRIRVDQGALAAQVANRGLIIADGGQAVMTAQAAQALADTVLNQQGVIRARSLVERDGKIVLDGGSNGVTLNSGTLDATGAAGRKGGSIDVLGYHVGLTGPALVDASGDTGGGAIHVGGGWQGSNPLLRHAAGTFAGPDVTLRANAGSSGNGGTVVLWSDGATRMFGSASAKGGARAGNGGKIETSGHFLDTRGARVDSSAAHGAAGNWLLDPYDLFIVAGTSGPTVQGSPNFVSDGTASAVLNQDIVDALNLGTDVTVTTGPGGTGLGNIGVNADIIKTTGGNASLTLNAARDISVQSNVQITSTAGKLNVDFNADSGNTGFGRILMNAGSSISTNGGNVRMYGQSDPVNGFASGSDGNDIDGVYLNQTTIDAGVGGNILIRGRGLNDVIPGNGVVLDNAIVRSFGGDVAITGVGGPGAYGMYMLSPEISSTTGGSIDLRGLALPNVATDTYNTGLFGDDPFIHTTGAGGNITLSGESTGAPGIDVSGGVIGVAGTGTRTNGDITLRAFSTPSNGFSGQMLVLPSSIETTGIVNLRPGGVAANGALAARDNVAIAINGISPPPETFFLAQPLLESILSPSIEALVIGSSTHTGAIEISPTAPFAAGYGMTLQNGGAGSAGIVVNGPLTMTAGDLALSSGGSVTQNGAITAGNLLLQGSQPASRFTLTDAGNLVDTLHLRFDQPKGSGTTDGSAIFINSGALSIGPVAGVGVDGTSNLRQNIGGSGATVAGDLVLQSAGLTLAESLLMGGANSRLQLSSSADLAINAPVTMDGAGSSVQISAGGDAAINAAIHMGGANAQESISANGNVNVAADLTTLGADAFVGIGADGSVTLGGNVSMQGDRSQLTLQGNSDSSTISTSGAITMSGADATLLFTAPDAITSGGAITMSGPGATQTMNAGANLTVTGPIDMLGNNSVVTFTSPAAISLGGPVNLTGDFARLSAAGAGVTNTGTIGMSGADAALRFDGANNVFVGGAIALTGARGDIAVQSANGNVNIFSTIDATGDNASLQLQAGQDLQVAADLNLAGSSKVHKLSAGRDIAVNSGAVLSNGSGAPGMNLDFNADADGVGGGSIAIEGDTSIVTNGGAVRMYGQGDAVNGFVTGNGLVHATAITIANSSISTGAGALNMRGQGTSFVLSGPPVPAKGIALTNATLNTGSGALSLTGIGGAGGDGVTMVTSTVGTLAGGALDIRGRSGAALPGVSGIGVSTLNSTLGGSGAGQIAISGESAGASGVAFSGGSIGAAGTTGNIVLRALSTGQGTGAPPMLSLGGTVRTSGVINIAPGGVSDKGVLSEQTGTTIALGGAAAAGEFGLSPAALDSAIQAGSTALVIGSAAHSGAINVTASAPLSGNYDLTLQNDGAGSAGINLYSGLSIPARLLTLSSGGSVTQGAAIVAGRLLLHGAQPQSNFQLANTGNAVGRVSANFDVPKSTASPAFGDVNFYSTGNLEIGPITGSGFNGATRLPQSLAAPNAVIAGDLLAQAAGNLTLQQNISTLGSEITLVTGGVLLNPVNATLTPSGGDRWRVFADSWVGQVTGGLAGTAPHPNYYNCQFGAACMSLLPATNNYFVYRQQPVLNLTLVTPTQSRVYGAPNPAYPFTASGLVNGDALAASVSGAYTVPAAVDVGSYAVNGAFASPVGYLVTAAPGTLNVTPATLTYVAVPATRNTRQPNPPFSGTVTGLVNGDTLASAAPGTLAFTSPAGSTAPAGQYAIDGSGLTARNYVFQQDPANATALTITRAPALLATPSIMNDVSMPSSDLYGANYGSQRGCAGSGPLAGGGSTGATDMLALEWSRVRESPNLSNCIGMAQRYTCGDF